VGIFLKTGSLDLIQLGEVVSEGEGISANQLKVEDAGVIAGNCDLKNGARCQFCRFKACRRVFPPREFMTRFKSGTVLF